MNVPVDSLLRGSVLLRTGLGVASERSSDSRSRPNVQLAQYALRVSASGVRADTESSGDAIVRRTCGEQASHLRLPIGEAEPQESVG